MKENLRKLNYIITPLVVLLFNLLIIFFPKDTIEAARTGLSLWFNNVLPSLLPFVIGTNILISLGFVNFLGVLLAPVMRPLFGVPGCGGFALAAGLSSGYPVGAKVVSELRARGDVTREEGQRLLGFVNNAGPLFVLGTVAGGIFGNAGAGYFILLVHYLSALVLGLAAKHFGGAARAPERASAPLLSRAFRAMTDARARDGRRFGSILGGAVMNAMESILQVGGFIILFCVLTRALDIVGFFDLLDAIFGSAGLLLGFPKELNKGIFTGIIEITNGCMELGNHGLSRASLVAAAAIISWGGLSVHAQAASFIGKTDLSTAKYILSKLAHALLAALLGLLIYPFFEKSLAESTAVSTLAVAGFAQRIVGSSACFALILCGALLAAALAGIVRAMRRWRRY